MKYNDLENCKLCAWECGVDRLAGEQGVCMMGLPEVASCQLHSASPQSYTVFCSGCCFKCLNCQNWEIAHYPRIQSKIKGFGASRKLMEEAVNLARKTGLENIHWAGLSEIFGVYPSIPQRFVDRFSHQHAVVAAFYAQQARCQRIQRNCGKCDSKLSCDLKGYIPYQST